MRNTCRELETKLGSTVDRANGAIKNLQSQLESKP